jgi:hypothetical protein
MFLLEGSTMLLTGNNLSIGLYQQAGDHLPSGYCVTP